MNNEIPIYAQTDVLVAGGGLSGVAAAVSAARAGAKTMIVEKSGMFGGMASLGLVNPFMVSKNGGQYLVQGFFQELIELLKEKNACVEGELFGRPHIAFDAEILKALLPDILQEEKVDILLHAYAAGAICRENEAKGIIIEGKSGQKRLLAKVIIDATGDADIAYYCGAQVEKGRSKDGLMQPATLCFKVGGVSIENMPPREKINEIFNREKSTFPVKILRDRFLFFTAVRAGEIHVNTTRMLKVDGTEIEDQTKAEIEGRKQMMVLVDFLRRHISGCENAFIDVSAPQAGFRETRRVIGEYLLTKQDILECKKFDDAIAASNYPLDMHAPSGEGVDFLELKPNTFYEMPLRCLIPKKIENLLVVGRPISVSHEAYSSTRVMPTCVATGQAGGALAAISIKNKINLRKIDSAKVQQALIAEGAFIHEGR